MNSNATSTALSAISSELRSVCDELDLRDCLRCSNGYIRCPRCGFPFPARHIKEHYQHCEVRRMPSLPECVESDLGVKFVRD